jgi:hypothetical protein
MTIGSAYIQNVIKVFLTYKGLSEKTFIQLGDGDFYFMPNESSNSLALIIQHLHGNMMSRWTDFLTTDGEKTWRQRDEEFEPHSYPRARLIELWEEGWSCTLDALRALQEDDLLKTIHIRGEAMTVVDGINRQLAHYAYHVGQIAYIGKIILDDQFKSLTVPKKKRS